MIYLVINNIKIATKFVKSKNDKNVPSFHKYLRKKEAKLNTKKFEGYKAIIKIILWKKKI